MEHSKKGNNLLLKWVNQIYLKGKDWWQYQPTTDSCWKICIIKEKFAPGYDENTWISYKGVYTIQSGYRWR